MRLFMHRVIGSCMKVGGRTSVCRVIRSRLVSSRPVPSRLTSGGGVSDANHRVVLRVNLGAKKQGRDTQDDPVNAAHVTLKPSRNSSDVVSCTVHHPATANQFFITAEHTPGGCFTSKASPNSWSRMDSARPTTAHLPQVPGGWRGVVHFTHPSEVPPVPPGASSPTSRVSFRPLPHARSLE